MPPSYRRLRFPLWQFLNQPLFDPIDRAVLNPMRFWYFYRVQLLERCLVKEYKPGERHCE